MVWDTGTWQPRGELWQLTDSYLDDDVVFLSADGKVLAIPDDDVARPCGTSHTRTQRQHIVSDRRRSSPPWR